MLKINRRNFFKGFSAGLLGLGLKNSLSPLAKEDQIARQIKINQYKSLGNTGLKVSDIAFGGSTIFSADVVRFAFEMGVNLFDTAESYMNGKSEEYVGAGLKGVRDKAFIITKYTYRGEAAVRKDDVLERINRSLKRLHTDYLDVAFIHGINDLDALTDGPLLAAYEQLKRDGKIRFPGFSTHNAPLTLEQCLKPEWKDFSQVVLFIYNHMEGQKIEALVKKVREAGIGTIAMKSQAGGKQGNLKSFVNEKESYETAAVKWVLGRDHIDSCVITMTTFSHVEEFVQASGKTLQEKELALLGKYRKNVDRSYCRLSCHECESSCPDQVAISDVMRFAMYFQDYGHEKNALHYYAQLADEGKPLKCWQCPGFCNRVCPFGLEVKEKLLQAHTLLSV